MRVFLAAGFFVAYCILLALYVFGPVFLLLKRLSDAAGSQKKLMKTYGLLFLLGGLSTIPAVFLERFLSWALKPDDLTALGCFKDSFIVAGFCEEFVKFAALFFIVRSSVRFKSYASGASFAAFVSLGFAFVENVEYVLEGAFYAGMQGAFITALVRALTSIPGHFVFSVFMGYFLALAVFGKKKGVNVFRSDVTMSEWTPKRRKNFFRNLALAFVAPVAAHGIYDFFVMYSGSDSELSGLSYVVFLFVLCGECALAKIAVESLIMKDATLLAKKGDLSGYDKMRD